jgi:hypothetical protein
MWLTVGNRGYIEGPEGARHGDHSTTAAYIGHGFADDLSFATGTLSNLQVQLRKLSLFSEYTGLDVKCSAIGALWQKRDTNSKDNKALLEQHLATLTIHIHKVPTPLPTHSPIEKCKVLGVELNISYRSQPTAKTLDASPLRSPPHSAAPPSPNRSHSVPCAAFLSANI